MTLSPHVSPPVPALRAVKPLWTFPTLNPPRGLCLAREKGWLLTWDDNHWLYLLSARGERQGQFRPPSPLAVACCADDGSGFVAAGSGGELWWLTPDLTPRWQQSLLHPAVAVALDPFGQYLAAADARGGLYLLDRDGRRHWAVTIPRPLHHLAFVPEAPFLLGAADYGLVVGVDMTGRVVWRDGLVVNVGSLAVSGDGSRVVLACFSDGLRCYTMGGARRGQMMTAEPCRLAALSFDGQLTLTAGRSNRLQLLDVRGRVLADHLLERPAVAVALAPLGDRAAAALADGGVAALDLADG